MAGSGSGSRWARHLVCSISGVTAPLDQPAFLSPEGRPWLVDYALDSGGGGAWAERLKERPWTLWRYMELLPVARPESVVSLGEGGTPLVPLRRFVPQAELIVKQEAGNPTGSFKDRGLTMAVNRARELGAAGVQLPSAGNAAIAMSAFAAANCLAARVAMPVDTPELVSAQCENYGAEVIRAGADLVESGAHLASLGGDFWNLATLKEPYRVEGKKTMGLELAEQLGWQLPDWIVYPTGGGTGIVGMAKAFDELQRLGLIGSERPRFVVVQMSGCAPIVRAFEEGVRHAEPWADPQTRVWGLRVPQAVGDFMILDALRSTDGLAVTVDEAEIEGVAETVGASDGVVVGPEGAAALVATRRLVQDGTIGAGERVVVFQTGHPRNYG